VAGDKVRAREVAALAQASQSTVSRVFAGDTRISEATRQRVFAAAKELNYQPNLIARSLKNASTGIVGVVVTDLDNPYHAHTLKLLIDEMSDRGLAPLVFACNSGDRAGAAIGRLMSYQVDAVIGLAAPFDTEIVARCAVGRKPLVLMNRYAGPEPVHVIGGGARRGGALVADHLVARGGRRFGYFAGEDSTCISQDREAGFRERLAVHGHDGIARAASRYGYAEAYAAAGALLAARPDAVFCANDTLAFALIDRARDDFACRVPEDLLVVGYDNSAVAHWPPYTLTSVDQNLDVMVAEAVTTALTLIEAPATPPRQREIEPRLVVRASTDARPVA
jgi:LacI family transcriptional regulator